MWGLVIDELISALCLYALMVAMIHHAKLAKECPLPLAK
jgi:hypothetical protein